MPNLLRQFGKNIVTSWLSLTVRMALVFAVNPFIIHSLGNHLYGVWVLVFSIINYMTILDLGLQQALIRFISKYLGLNDYNKINSILNTGFLIYSGIGVTVLLVTFVLSYFSLNWFNIPSEYISEGRGALFIIGLNTALTFIMLPWGGTLGAFHRYDIANGIAIVEDISRTVLIVILLKVGYGIVALAEAFLIFTLFRLLLSAAFLKKLHPPLKFGKSYVSKETMRLLFDYGFISFLISIAWLLIANSDNIVIGYFLDTSAVTIYAIAASFVVAIRSIIHAVSFPLRPLISHYEGQDERERIKFIFMKGTQYLYYLTFVIAGGTFVLADDFIRLWMGPGYEQSAKILRILIIPAAVYLPHAVGNSILYGIERHKRLLYIILAEGILNLSLSIFLVRNIGLEGVAYGTIMAQLVIYLFILPAVVRPIIKFELAGFYLAIGRAGISAFAIAAGLTYLLKMILSPEGWGIFSAEVIVAASLSIVAGYFLADKKDLQIIREGMGA